MLFDKRSNISRPQVITWIRRSSVRRVLLLCPSTPAAAQAADDTPPLPRSCALLSSSLQLSFMLPSSFSTVLFHVFFGLPLSRQPWGIHLRAFFVILLPTFLIVCPIQVHFLRVVVVSMESCSASAVLLKDKSNGQRLSAIVVVVVFGKRTFSVVETHQKGCQPGLSCIELTHTFPSSSDCFTMQTLLRARNH